MSYRSQTEDSGISQQIFEDRVLVRGHDRTTAIDAGDEEKGYPETKTF